MLAEDLRSLFLLRPDVAFLNHGSFGACPRPVFDVYQDLQRRIELQPVEFIARRAPGLLAEARSALGGLLGVAADDLVYVTNATVGVNIVARSLDLGPGDEVLASDHEYGACDRAWRFLCGKSGATYRRVRIPAPVSSPEDVAETLLGAVSERTRVLFLSHITSQTATTFPVAEICRRARQMGLITVIDGAHAPGQLGDLNLSEIDADFYVGNLHKWLCAPKGAAFLHARREVQPMLEPLVVSWGWEAAVPGPSSFIDHHEYMGTRDLSAALAVPAAIEFQREHDWEQVRGRCHEMVRQATPEIASAVRGEPLVADRDDLYGQMMAFLLPQGLDADRLKARLYDEHLVEIPVMPFNDRTTIRISIQGYNTWMDVERLLHGLRILVPELLP